MVFGYGIFFKIVAIWHHWLPTSPQRHEMTSSHRPVYYECHTFTVVLYSTGVDDKLENRLIFLFASNQHKDIWKHLVCKNENLYYGFWCVETGQNTNIQSDRWVDSVFLAQCDSSGSYACSKVPPTFFMFILCRPFGSPVFPLYFTLIALVITQYKSLCVWSIAILSATQHMCQRPMWSTAFASY